MASQEPNSALPLLGIVLDTPGREFFPLTYVEAAAGVCRPLWINLRDDEETRRYARILKRSGQVVDVAGLSTAAASTVIAQHSPAGIVAFNEANVPWSAEVAEALALPYHGRRTAAQLADKFMQRSALRDGGLATPGFWDIGALADSPELLSEVEANAAFPLVLKPRVGRSSRDMARVDSVDRLREIVATTWADPMMVEEYIPDPTHPMTGSDNAFYVSVEVLASHGTANILGATGRHPLVEPFREAGLFFPAEVSAALRDELAETAAAAARALGIENGALHVEIKATDAGPVVIEINPRPGGSALPDLLQHALGINIFREAMRIAVGENPDYSALPLPTDVGFSVYVLPPAEVRHITSVQGLDTLSALDGVESVIPKRGAGDSIDPHEGMLEYIVRVSGTAPDHDVRRRTRARILSQVVVRGTP